MKSGVLSLLVLVFLSSPVARADTAQKEPVTLGMIASLSGYGAAWGEDEANGAILAVEEINGAGGIGGRQIKLVVEDNTSSQERTARAFAKLAGIDRVPVVFGPNWAEFAEVAAPLAQQNTVVLVTASGWTRTLTDNRPLVFSTLPSHDAVVESLCVEVARRHKRVELLHTESAYFSSLARSMAECLRKHGLKDFSETSFPPGGSDYRSYLSRLRRDPPDALVFFLIEGEENLLFLKQLRLAKLSSALYASNGLLADQDLKQHPELTEGIVAFDFMLPSNDAFRKRYLVRFKKAPGTYSSRAYDNVFLVKTAAERCGWDAEALAKCLQETRHEGVSGPLHFDARRNVEAHQPVSLLVRSEGGRFMPYAGMDGGRP